MYSGKRIINIDESVLNETDSRRRGWFKQGVTVSLNFSSRINKLNIIAGVSNGGDFFYTLNVGANNSQTVLLFLMKLADHLDSVDPSWR